MACLSPLQGLDETAIPSRYYGRLWLVARAAFRLLAPTRVGGQALAL